MNRITTPSITPGTIASGTMTSGFSITIIDGIVHGDPTARRTAAGERIDLDVVTQSDGRRVACTVLADPAGYLPVAGERVLVIGTTQRRFFRSGSVTATRTEVVARVVVPWADRRRRRRAVDEVLEQLAALRDAAARSRR
jgi:hypothetical protein